MCLIATAKRVWNCVPNYNSKESLELCAQLQQQGESGTVCPITTARTVWNCVPNYNNNKKTGKTERKDSRIARHKKDDNKNRRKLKNVKMSKPNSPFISRLISQPVNQSTCQSTS